MSPWLDAHDTLRSPGSHRLLRGAELDRYLAENDARWKAEQAALRQAEEEAARARADRPGEHQRRRRARKAAVPHEPYTRQEVFDRDGGRCYMCDRRLPPGWHVEHVIPIARGGADTLDNVRASCPRCNLRKGTQEPCYRT